MALGKDYVKQDCSLARALEVVGERWTLLIVRDALYGVRRFGHFLTHLEIPRAVLSTRLQSLVEAGVLEKDGQDYVLTAVGRELWPALHMLARWGERNYSGRGPCRLFFHVPCDTRIGADGVCPACAIPAPLEELEVRPGPGMNPEKDDPISVALRRPHRMLAPFDG
ncbi:winged helix-turn-helix transcriptional regulator [Actinomadura sp. SCN-SB]|uniref:winged helix-turn-helix transcriptional regulator n=1 Tax=Actinomadura sp. SCN-SB TaxID=3373092 RepID=UPI003751EC8E